MTVQENLVSTIIPVFNRPEMLRLAVASVLAQTHRPIEVIIADDGSTDATPEVARQLVDEHPGVVHYRRQENSGPGPARELGRGAARGEFIQYLDSDDRLLPNKFTDQIAALRSAPDCDVAYGVTRLVTPEGAVLRDPYKWTARKIDALFPGLLVDRWWCTHTPLYRRRLTDRIGSWCDMRWSQDWEYDSRIGALRTKLVHCGSHVSEHVDHDGQRQTSSAAWATDPVRLRNRVRLLGILMRDASLAGVPETADERQHFARWCFMIGRQCATQSLREEAARCFSLAEMAAGPSGPGRRGIKLYRALLGTVGASATGRLESLLQRLKGGPGASTMQQSFAAES